jgi:four helix bundle protein
LRRAAISVCSNIAEGAARRSKQEKKRFYEIARSSAVQIDTQLEAALLPEYRRKDQPNELEQYLESAFRMLSKMIENFDNQPPTSHFSLSTHQFVVILQSKQATHSPLTTHYYQQI